MDFLFNRYQKEIVKLANLDGGRKFLGIDHEVPKDKWIAKVTPNSYHYINGDKVTAVFRCYPVFTKRMGAALTELDIASQYQGLDKYVGLLNYAGLLESLEFPTLMLASKTLYSEVGDGVVSRTNGTDTFQTVRNNSTGTSVDYTTASYYFTYNTAPSAVGICYRSLVPFVTSSLGAGAEVTAATASIYGGTDPEVKRDDDAQDIGITLSTQASVTEITTDDYDAITLNSAPEGSDARVTLAAWNESGYNNWVLNATGMGWVAVSGNTKFCFRGGDDLDDTNPTSYNYCTCEYSENSGTTVDPKLAVTYTPGGGGAFLAFM